MQSLGGEAQSIEDARPEVLDEDVGPLHESGEDVASVVGFEVEDDRLLVAVRREVVGRDRVVLGPDEGRSPTPGVVTGVGLDLDDASTHVPQHHSRLRPGESPGEVDDEDVGEGTGCGGLGRVAHEFTVPVVREGDAGRPCRRQGRAVGRPCRETGLARARSLAFQSSPMSSFHRAGWAAMKSVINRTHSSDSALITSTPLARRWSSPPRKVLFSPRTTRGMP